MIEPLEFLRALAPNGDERGGEPYVRLSEIVRLGVYTGVRSVTGYLAITFDGESVETLCSWQSQLSFGTGSRVVCLRAGNGWFVLGGVQNQTT